MTERKLPISQLELVSLLAMLSATVAFSLDAMLPALPQIGDALSPDNPNRVQLVVGSFVLGLGLGTFFTGALSDAFGRRPVAVVGALIYCIAALVAAFSPNLETLLIARFVQGLGAAGPRITAMAIARDLFSGRRMAQVISYVIFVFTLTPIFAPSMGWAIAQVFGWRGIFASFAVFSVISMAWLLIRLPETLPPENVRPFRARKLMEGAREVLGNRRVVLATLVQTLIFGTLFSALATSQQIFGEVFDKEDTFALWFGLMALLASGANLINARIVVRLGMRTVVWRALLVTGVLTLVYVLLQVGQAIPGALAFPLTFIWLTSLFYLAGFGIGNMNALALEPLGHMAGMAASIVTAIATIGAGLLTIPIGLAFNGTVLPLSVGVLVLVGLALVLLRQLTEDEVPASG
ncbi:MAG: multidrug effflux MFS transporter [Pseudomonadota bacterium]